MTPPEALTESERENLEVYVSVTGPESIRGVEDEVAKLLRIHDRLQGEVEMLRVQQGRYAMAIERLEAEAREMRESLELAEEMSRAQLQGQMLAEARVRELEAYCKAQAEASETLAQCLRERDTMLQQARAEGFGVIREPKAAYVAPSLETFDLGPDLTPTRSPR